MRSIPGVVVAKKVALFTELAAAAVRSPTRHRHSEGGSARGGAKGGPNSDEQAALLGGGEHGDEEDDLDRLEKGILVAHDRNQELQQAMEMGQEVALHEGKREATVLLQEKGEETMLQNGKGESLLNMGMAVGLQEENSKKVPLLLEKEEVLVEVKPQEENGKEPARLPEELQEENGKQAARLPEELQKENGKQAAPLPEELQEENGSEAAAAQVPEELQEENGKEAAAAPLPEELQEENDKEAALLLRGNEVMQRPANSHTASQLQEILPFNQHDGVANVILGHTTRPEWEGLEDSSSVRSFIQKSVREAQKRKEDPTAINSFILETAKKALKVSEVPPSRAGNSNSESTSNDSESSEMKRAKLVKDSLSEHQTLSKALYGMAFTFTIPVVVAKAASLLDKNKDNDETLQSMVLLMVCSFAVFTACHWYLLSYHFVRTVAPRVSLLYHRITSILLGITASCWFGVLTLSIPEQLYRSWFWYITCTFVLGNWALIIRIGWMRLVTEELIMEED